MNWYSHWARDYEEPPEDRWGDYEDDDEVDEEDDDRFDDWHKEADCWA